MNIVNYTRSLIRAAVRIHAASLDRVEKAADKAAERAYFKAEVAHDDADQTAEVLRHQRLEADRLYDEAYRTEQRAIAIGEAVDAELADLPAWVRP